MDAGAFAPCTSPFSPSGLLPGAHTLTVRARDAAGNVSAEATRAFTVASPPPPDTAKPSLSFTKKPKKKTKKRRATFVVAASETLAKLECKLDKGAFAACSATKKVKVKPGRHTFQVRGTDAAGNVSTMLKFRWKVKRK